MKRLMLTAAAGVAFGLALSASPALACDVATTGYGTARVPAMNLIMERALTRVRAMYPNPDAVEVKDVYLCRGVIEAQITCGFVRAPGPDGILPEYQRFLTNGRQDATYLEADTPNFDLIWADTCVPP